MHANNDMRTPFLKLPGHITNGTLVEELSGIRAKAIDEPIIVLHPMLFVSQQPVVDSHHLCGQMMRLFHRANGSDRVRLAFHKAFDAGHNRRCRRSMSAARVGRDDEDFWTVWVHYESRCNPALE